MVKPIEAAIFATIPVRCSRSRSPTLLHPPVVVSVRNSLMHVPGSRSWGVANRDCPLLLPPGAKPLVSFNASHGIPLRHIYLPGENFAAAPTDRVVCEAHFCLNILLLVLLFSHKLHFSSIPLLSSVLLRVLLCVILLTVVLDISEGYILLALSLVNGIVIEWIVITLLLVDFSKQLRYLYQYFALY